MEKIKIHLSKLPYELLERICKEIADKEEDKEKEGKNNEKPAAQSRNERKSMG